MRKRLAALAAGVALLASQAIPAQAATPNAIRVERYSGYAINTYTDHNCRYGHRILRPVPYGGIQYGVHSYLVNSRNDFLTSFGWKTWGFKNYCNEVNYLSDWSATHVWTYDDSA